MDDATRHALISAFRSVLAEAVPDDALSDGLPLDFTYDEVSFAAYVRTRSSGTDVLTLGGDVIQVSDTVDVRDYVAAFAAGGTFSALAPLDSDSEEVDLMVWYTMIAATVTPEVLAEILDSLSHDARAHRHQIEALQPRDVSATSFSSDFLSGLRVTSGVADDDSIGANPVRDVNEILVDLQGLVGMAEVKDEIAAIVKAARVASRRAAKGLRADGPSPNLVFSGNPGTGKTTVARLVAELYAAIGLVPIGHLVETSRAGLVAEYLGQTAVKTEEVCERARGGVLFIDEAYALSPSGRDDFADEAIAALIQYMENHRGEIAVIVAGYANEMDRFLDANPGLRSRFDINVWFPDYSDDELVQIFMSLAEQRQYDLTDDAVKRLTAHIASLERGRGFGNAREMRKLFDNVVRRQALELDHPSRAGISRLRRIDAEAFPPLLVRPASRIRPGYL